MAVPNQFRIKINRHRIDYNKEKYIAVNPEMIQWIMTNLTPGALNFYLYMCAQVPDSYDGVRNEKNKRLKGFELSPKALHDYCGMNRKTYFSAIDQLMEAGFITDFGNKNYLFDDMPLKLRAKTSEEAEEIAELSIEEMYKLSKEQQMKEIAKENPEHWAPAAREKYSWE